MPPLSQAKAWQLIGTGALLVVFGIGIFALLFVVQGDKYDFGNREIFDRSSAFWTSIPVVVVGLLGVLAGITKNNLWIYIYMVGSAAAGILAILVAIVIGIKVSNIRLGCGEDGECKNSDTAVLMGTIVLLASILVTIATWGGVKACQSTWSPRKDVPSVYVVAEFRTNGSCPPPEVIIQPESQPHPSGEDTLRQEANPPPKGSSHKYEDVKPILTHKIDCNDKPNPTGGGKAGSDAGYETMSQEKSPRGDRTVADETGYEVMNSVQVTIEEHKYDNVQPGNTFTGKSQDKISMDMSAGGDPSRPVEVQRDPNHDACDTNIHENKAYESDELTTAL